MKFAHRIKKPFVYIPAAATDISKTIAKAKKRLEEQRQSVVTPLRERR